LPNLGRKSFNNELSSGSDEHCTREREREKRKLIDRCHLSSSTTAAAATTAAATAAAATSIEPSV